MAIRNAGGNPLDATKEEVERTHRMFQKKAKEYNIPDDVTDSFWKSYKESVEETKKEVFFFKTL